MPQPLQPPLKGDWLRRQAQTGGVTPSCDAALGGTAPCRGRRREPHPALRATFPRGEGFWLRLAGLPPQPRVKHHISRFAAQGLNISKIESRPIPGRNFEFRFYFDVEGDISDPRLQAVLGQMEKDAMFTFLGAYTEIA